MERKGERVREGEGERGRKGERDGEKGRERKGERVREGEGERERGVLQSSVLCFYLHCSAFSS